MVPLRDNELFGSVGDHRLPITCGSGADISVVPEECVLPEQLMGSTCQVDSFNKIRSTGKLCNITITINGRPFQRKALTQPGSDLTWTACLSLPFANREERDSITQQMDEKFKLIEEELCYLPPEMKDRILKSGLMVSEGTLVVAKSAKPAAVQQEVVNEQVEKEVEIEVVEQGDREDVVLVTAEKPSVDDEAEGEPLEGSAEEEGTQEVSI